MIRFSAGLVVVAIGVLIGGIATSKLLLVYVAIGLSAAALLALAIGVALKREELFGEQRQVLAPAADASAGKSFVQPNGAVDTPPARVPAATPTAFGEAFPGSGGTAHRAGQSPSDRPGALGYSGFGQPGLPGRETPPAREGLAARDGSGSGGGSHYARPGAPGYGAGRAGQDMTRPERYAGPFRLDSPGAPATPAAPAAAARPAAQASNAASAPPVSPVTPPPATSPPSPVPPWRERLSPPDGDPLGSAASSRAESGSRPGPGSSAPDWPSWFDRQARLARDDAAAPATPRVPAEEADDTGAASRVTPAVAADDADSGASATTPEAAEDNTSAAEDNTSAAEHGASADADPALSASTDADPPLGASTEADPALSAAAETDDAEAGELGHPADPESSSDYELPSDLVSADTASTDEADPADDTAGSGEQRDDEPTAGRGSGSGQVTVVPGVPRYHKQNCILIRFMADEDMQKMTAQEAAETGCTPCRACQPDPA